MEQEKKKNELLKLCVWDEKKEGPMGTAKALEASLSDDKRLDNVPM